MLKNPSVTVAVFNYNGLTDTQKCLRSLLKTKYDNFKILVIDDCSENDEVEELKRLFKGKNIRYISGNKNLGLAFRFNQAFRLASTKYVLLLNNDTKVNPSWIRYLVRVAESDPAIAACQPKIKSMTDPDYFEYAGASGGFVDRLGFPYSRGRVMFHLEKDVGQYDDVRDIFWGSGAAILIKKEAAKKAGGFDEDFFSYHEELDFCWRLKRLGYRLRVVPKAVVYHKGVASWSKMIPRKNYLIHRNHYFVLLKNVPYRDLIWMIPLCFFLDILAIAYYIKQGSYIFPFTVIKAHLSVFNSFSYWLGKRSKGIDPERKPFSIVWRYFVNHNKKFSQILKTDNLNEDTIMYKRGHFASRGVS